MLKYIMLLTASIATIVGSPVRSSGKSDRLIVDQVARKYESDGSEGVFRDF